MNSSLDLKLDVVGRYRWGSLVCAFPLAPATAKTVIDEVASYSARALHFETAAHGRAVLSFMHELVHYLQDLTTGAGHWDHLVHYRANPNLLGHAKHAWDLATSMGVTTDELPDLTRRLLAASPGKKIHDQMESELLLAPADVLVARNVAIVAKLSAEIGPAVERTDAAQLLSLGSVLETDAMAAVLIQVLERQWTTDAAELLPELASLWNPSAMDQAYYDLFATTFVAAGFEDEEKGRQVNVLATAYLVALVSDLALAHPPPGYLAAHGLDAEQFEPGLRFSRLWRALVAASHEETAEFLAAWREGALETCERLLLARTVFPYPAARVTYAAWVDELEQIARGTDDAVLGIRLEAAHTRAEGHPILAPKGAQHLITLQCPLVVQAAGKTHYVWQGLRAIDHDAQASYVWGVAQSDRENQTVAYYHAARPFVCSLAGQHLCDAVQPTCVTGWTEMSTLPAREVCSTRRLLETAHLPLV